MLGSEQAMCQFGTMQRPLVLALFGLVLLSAREADACSCVQRDDGELLASSDKVFAGEVERIEVDGHACESVVDCGQHCRRIPNVSVVVSLRVQSSYKNVTEERVRVETEASSAACGASFETGQGYLVFASVDEAGESWTTSCHGTGPSSLEEADRRMKRVPSSVPASSHSSHCHCRVGARSAGGEAALAWGAVVAGPRREAPALVASRSSPPKPPHPEPCRAKQCRFSSRRCRNDCRFRRGALASGRVDSAILEEDHVRRRTCGSTRFRLDSGFGGRVRRL